MEIRRLHKEGRPILVGTTSVEQSENLAQMLKDEGIPHQVLNAKPENVEKESEIVAQSGRRVRTCVGMGWLSMSTLCPSPINQNTIHHTSLEKKEERKKSHKTLNSK